MWLALDLQQMLLQEHEPTEEKWTKELSHLELMHEYLRANKLSQMIPSAFKTKPNKKKKQH